MTNTEYWRNKIDGNRRRDRETDKLLTAAGWLVLRFWEHEDPQDVADLIERSVRLNRAELDGESRSISSRLVAT